MRTTYWEVGLALVMLSIWAISIRFMVRALKASQDKKNKVKHALMKMVFYSGRLWWIERPENEEDEEKMQKYTKAVGTMAIELGVVALMIIGIGLIPLGNGDRSPFIMLCIIVGPLIALIAMYYAFLWKLLSEENVKKR